MAKNKKIDSELLSSLKNMIDNLGGLKSASRFLGISTQNLKGYLEGSRTDIRDDYWMYNIKPVINKSRNELLDHYSIKFMRNEKKTNELDYYEYLLDKEKEDCAEKVLKYIENPFNVYFLYFSKYGKNYDYPMIDIIKSITCSDKIERDEVVINLYDFRRLYELFRPNNITHGSPYHGSVKYMDQIFKTFEDVLNIKHNEKVSKYDSSSWIDALYKSERKVEDVNWVKLLSDVKMIKESIDTEIIELAMDNLDYFKLSHSHWFTRTLYRYIEKYYEFDNSLDFSSKNISVGGINIKNNSYEFKSRYECKSLLYNLFKYKDND